ncbi:Ribonuclease H-like protein, partial [Metarhizium majus ARSEF 297]
MWHAELGTKSSPDGAESVRERTAGASGRHHSCIPIRKPVGLRVPTPRHAAYLDEQRFAWGVSLDVLLRWSAPERTLVAGDFNAKHYSWQTGRLEGWAAENGLNLLNTVDVPTNPHGNTIDLAFSNIALASAVPEPPTGGNLPLGFSQQVQLARREFQRVVRRAKRQYWRNLIDGFLSVYKAVRWLKLPGAFQPPPVTTYTKPSWIKRTRTTLRTHGSRSAQPDATIKTGNTSPGADNITVKLLQAVWDIIGGHVCRLYQGCLTVGHHPRAFREAEVVMIPKPGKRNLSPPRAWRPISLLSCLGKGLERLIARRLAWASIYYAVLHPQQAGALPKRSAVDLVAALIHDIEEAFTRGQVATLVTEDIQGAFDTAMCNRLVLRLREQGWGLSCAVGRLVHERPLRKSPIPRHHDTNGTIAVRPSTGIARVSDLVLLYTEPIYRLGNPEGRFGYADGTNILCTGQSLEETSRIASEYLQELVSWGAANGILFDPEKTEVMHFSLRRRETVLPVRHGDVEKQPETAMRWLDLWLDRKLTFKTHVEKRTAKAQAVAHHLRSLGEHPARRLAERRAEGRQGLCRADSALRLGSVNPAACAENEQSPQAGHPSHSPDLEDHTDRCLAAESGIPPVHQLLEARRLRFSARIKSLDHAHPLAKRTTEIAPRPIIKCIKLKYQLPPKAFLTRLRRTDKSLANCQRPVLVPRRYSSETPQPLQTASKEDSAKHFLHWLQSIPPSTLIVYSDGSLSPSGAAGYGFTVHQNGHSIRHGAGRLGSAEVFDAEAKGALEGLKAALNLPQSVTQKIVVCLDNIAAAKCLRGKPSDSSQRVFLTFQALAKTLRKTEVRWIPGHTKIPGNEQADVLAKAGCAKPEPADAVPTLAFLRKTARQRAKIAVQAWWDASAPGKYKHLNLKFPSNCLPELALPRTILHHLLAARTYHGDFADYHERSHHSDAGITCSCGRRKAPTHLFLPEDPAALSNEACSLTDRGDQPGNR